MDNLYEDIPFLSEVEDEWYHVVIQYDIQTTTVFINSQVSANENDLFEATLKTHEYLINK